MLTMCAHVPFSRATQHTTVCLDIDSKDFNDYFKYIVIY